MELRKQGQCHFIHAIVTGRIRKVMNVGTCGKPTVSFRSIEDVCGRENHKSCSASANAPERELTNCSPPDRGSVIKESQHPRTAEVIVKSDSEEAYDYERNHCDLEENTFPDDNIFGSMTLKQIQDRYKATKRKRSDQDGPHAEMADGGFTIAQKFSPLEDEEFDAEDPLSNWMFKLLRHQKVKKRKEKYFPSKSPCALSFVTSEIVDSDSVSCHVRVDLPALSDKGVYFPGPVYENCCLASVFADLPIRCNEGLSRSGKGCLAVRNSNNTEGALLTVSPTTEALPCTVNEAFYNFEETIDPEPVINGSVSGWEIVKVGTHEISNQQDSVFSTILPSSSSVCEEFYDFEGAAEPEPVVNGGVSGLEIMKVDGKQDSGFPITKSTDERYTDRSFTLIFSLKKVTLYDMENAHQRCSGKIHASGLEIIGKGRPDILPISELRNADHRIHTRLYSNFLNEYFQGLGYDMQNKLRAHPFMKLISWRATQKSPPQALDMAVDNQLVCYEPDSSGILDASEDIVEVSSSIVSDDTSSESGSGSWSLYPSSHLDVPRCWDSDDDSTTLSEGNAPPFENRIARESCTPICFGLTERRTFKEIKHDHETLQHPPKRLLSARKVISPDSRKRLCKAIEHSDLQRDKTNKCGGKLYFSYPSNHRILKAEGLGNIQWSDFNASRKQPEKKICHGRKRSKRKGKSEVSSAQAGFCTSSTSVQACSQNAILFTTRQLNNTKRLAVRLTKELASMKNLMKETVGPMSSSLKAPKRYTDQIMAAIENANKVEETTRKWLSMMTRDCTRFCKLMESVEESPAATFGTLHRKKRKRLVFADEVGGKLCHVKYLEKDPASDGGVSCDNISVSPPHPPK